MLYRELKMQDDGEVVFTITDMGQQDPAIGDDVIVCAHVIPKSLINFGRRVKIPSESCLISWEQIFRNKEYFLNFTAPTYNEAIDKAKAWLDKVAEIVLAAVLARRAARFKAGNGPKQEQCP